MDVVEVYYISCIYSQCDRYMVSGNREMRHVAHEKQKGLVSETKTKRFLMREHTERSKFRGDHEEIKYFLIPFESVKTHLSTAQQNLF